MPQTHTNPAYFCALKLGFRSRWKQTRLYNKIRINCCKLFTIPLFHTNQCSLLSALNLYSRLQWLVKPPCVTCQHMLNNKKKHTHTHARARNKFHYAETRYYALDILSQMGSAFGIIYRLEGRNIVVWFLAGEAVLSSQESPHQLGDPSSLLFNGQQKRFPRR